MGAKDVGEMKKARADYDQYDGAAAGKPLDVTKAVQTAVLDIDLEGNLDAADAKMMATIRA